MENAETENDEMKELRKRRQVQEFCVKERCLQIKSGHYLFGKTYIYQVSTKYHFCPRCHAPSWKQIISYFMSKFYNLRKVCARKAHNFNSKINREKKRERANINLTRCDRFILHLFAETSAHFIAACSDSVSQICKLNVDDNVGNHKIIENPFKLVGSNEISTNLIPSNGFFNNRTNWMC